MPYENWTKEQLIKQCDALSLNAKRAIDGLAESVNEVRALRLELGREKARRIAAEAVIARAQRELGKVDQDA